MPSDKPPRSTRQTPTHVFFYGGPLSNWAKPATPIPGSTAMSLLLARLSTSASTSSISHPSPDAFSTRLLSSFAFNCNEQFMMALKGWFFERSLPLSEQPITSDTEFESLRTLMLGRKLPPKNKPQQREMYHSTICLCLRAASAKEQKGYGKKCPGFSAKVWDKVSVDVVVSGLLARAEVDEELRAIYLESGGKIFVEGSPVDKIWGVGLSWDAKEVEDESNWKGENRLGRCHGLARAVVVEKYGAEEKRESKGEGDAEGGEGKVDGAGETVRTGLS